MGLCISCRGKTASREIGYLVEFASIESVTIAKFCDKARFEDQCKNGCHNYARKWSCPPHSPSYEELAGEWGRLYVSLFQIEMGQFGYIKNDYLKIKAANRILKSRADRFLRHISNTKKCFIISTGSCQLCKPCKCKLHEPCKHPDEMAYSFEAIGVNVGLLVEHCFEKELLWYKRGYLPKYTSVVVGLLSNDSISLERLKNDYLQIEPYTQIEPYMK